jgi:hypothetical protein
MAQGGAGMLIRQPRELTAIVLVATGRSAESNISAQFVSNNDSISNEQIDSELKLPPILIQHSVLQYVYLMRPRNDSSLIFRCVEFKNPLQKII